MRNKAGLFLVAFIILAASNPLSVFASEPTSDHSATLIAATVSAKPVVDIRGKVLEEYLKAKNSPMQGNASALIAEADKNDLDWELIPSIAGVESGYCNAIPANSYNCWGFGVYGSNVRRFGSWDEGIATVAASLKTDYIDKRKAKTVADIGQIYASDPGWAYKVEHNITELDTYYSKFADKTLSISL